MQSVMSKARFSSLNPLSAIEVQFREFLLQPKDASSESELLRMRIAELEQKLKRATTAEVQIEPSGRTYVPYQGMQASGARAQDENAVNTVANTFERAKLN